MLDEFHTASPVFPAHAGMSLEQIANGDYFVSFPRSRGDEPLWDCLKKSWQTFSPLTRG